MFERTRLCFALLCAILLASTSALAQAPPGEDSEPVFPAEGTAGEAGEAEEETAPESAESSEEEDEMTEDEGPGEQETATEPVEASPGEEPEEAPEAPNVPDVVTQRIQVTTGVQRIPQSDVKVAWNEDLDEYLRRYAWELSLGGYLRTQLQFIEDDPGGTFGRNDGFILANARLTIEASMRRSLGFRLQLDGAVDRSPLISDPAEVNQPDAEVVTRLKDAYIFWFPVEYSGLVVGQFKAPFDIEEIQSTADILFINRSVGSRGVRGVEGFNVRGLSIARETGAMLTSGKPVYPMAEDTPEGFGFSYSLALTNGAASNRSLNDNDSFAYYGRGALHWGEYVALGGAYFSNDATVGRPPDEVGEDITGFTGDLTVTVGGLTAIASYIEEDRETPQLAMQPSRVGRAYQGSIAYQEPFFGVQPAFRFAWFDPSAEFDGDSASTLANDALTHYTIGLNYNPRYPVRVMLNYTVAQEEERRTLENNRFDALLQVMW